MENEQIRIEYVPITEIKPNEYNPKKINEHDAKELEQSYLRFGMVDPIIINSAVGREGVIIGGHQRYVMLRKLKVESVPVVRLNIPELQREKELCLRLSKNQGHFDLKLLSSEFEPDFLLSLGWKQDELINLDIVDSDNFDGAGINYLDCVTKDKYGISIGRVFGIASKAKVFKLEEKIISKMRERGLIEAGDSLGVTPEVIMEEMIDVLVSQW